MSAPVNEPQRTDASTDTRSGTDPSPGTNTDMNVDANVDVDADTNEARAVDAARSAAEAGATAPTADSGGAADATATESASAAPPRQPSGSRDAQYWAQPVSKLNLGATTPDGVMNLNVEGRRLVGPLQGFGQMWQKTYSVRLSGANATPAEVITVWKENFPSFWPPGNRFFAPLTAIAPGEVAVLNLAVPGRLRLSTGILVLFADDESFAFMTPEGHMFAAWITFSAREEDGAPVAQIDVLLRANDPIYEMGLVFFGAHKMEDRFWEHTLMQLAARFGVRGHVQTRAVRIDGRRQWGYARNIWQNAMIRSMIYQVTLPPRWAGRSTRKLIAARSRRRSQDR
jgi:hypothetical protein